MNEIDLHKFEDDLKLRATTFGTTRHTPPVCIRAKDLDGNYKKVTLIESDQEPPLYNLQYTKDGTRLTRLLPDGAAAGDLLYWNGSRWLVLSAPSSTALRVLTIQGGALAWTATEECE
jgi:hypothetical protein